MSMDKADIYGMVSHKTSHATKRNKSRSHVVPERADFTSVAYAKYFQNERARVDHEAQHGPVRILIKDGKPVA